MLTEVDRQILSPISLSGGTSVRDPSKRTETTVTESSGEVNLESESAFMKLLGLSFDEMGPERVVASFETGPDHHQPWRLFHGGVFMAVIETVATTGAYQAVKDQGQCAVGVNKVTDRPPARF